MKGQPFKYRVRIDVETIDGKHGRGATIEGTVRAPLGAGEKEGEKAVRRSLHDACNQYSKMREAS